MGETGLQCTPRGTTAGSRLVQRRPELPQRNLVTSNVDKGYGSRSVGPAGRLESRPATGSRIVGAKRRRQVDVAAARQRGDEEPDHHRGFVTSEGGARAAMLGQGDDTRRGADRQDELVGGRGRPRVAADARFAPCRRVLGGSPFRLPETPRHAVAGAGGEDGGSRWPGR